jgi:predicted short-subunit dehydrogenase-like oxidoreductase (DUF2520 family)
MKIVFLGAGNLATHLAPALQEKGAVINQVYSRSETSAKTLAQLCRCDYTTSPDQIKTDGELYLIALRDDVVEKTLNKLEFIPSCIAHTSGSLGLHVFPEKFKHAGVFYPLQTFSRNSSVDFKSIPFCIESNSEQSLSLLMKTAGLISEKVIEITTEQRNQLHLAAVFANNFSNHLFSLSVKLLKEKNIPSDLLNELILETSRKAVYTDPESAQSGPARRGDLSVIEKHLKMLDSHPELKQLYRMFTDSIMDQYGKSL